jgi:hypothetical protein
VEPFGLALPALLAGARLEGFAIDEPAVAVELEHLSAKRIGVVRVVGVALSRSVKRYKLTAKGRLRLGAKRAALPQPKTRRDRFGNHIILGWKLIASNDAGTLARCSAGFVLRTDRVNARGEKEWPCNQQMLTARQARAWLRANVLAVAFPRNVGSIYRRVERG